MKKTYPSKIDNTIITFILLVLGVVTAIFLKERIWFAALFLSIFFALIIYSLSTIQYQIQDNFLIIRTFHYQIYKLDIFNLLSITETNNPLSAPAASFDRLDLRFKISGSILVSPKNKEAFIQDLLTINPEISIKRKNKKS